MKRALVEGVINVDRVSDVVDYVERLIMECDVDSDIPGETDDFDKARAILSKALKKLQKIKGTRTPSQIAKEIAEMTENADFSIEGHAKVIMLLDQVKWAVAKQILQ